MFRRIGQFAVNRPWLTIAVWVVAAVAIVTLSPKLSTTTDESAFLPKSYESIQAQELQKQAFPDATSPAALIVFTRADGATMTGPDFHTVARIDSQLTKFPPIQGYTSTPPDLDAAADAGRTSPVVAVAVGMPAGNPNDSNRLDAVKSLRDQLHTLTAGTDLKAGVTGDAAIALDNRDAGQKSMAIVAVVTIGLILVLLLLIFRSPIVALLPIVVIGLVSQVATGLIGDVNKAFNLNADSSIQEILIVVLFGVGTDYILFLMFRYRERLRMGEDPKTAMVSAVSRVGEAIASAAGAVIIAFMALALSSLSFLRSMGPSLAVAVAVTLLAGLTLVPAVVSLLGTKVFWPSKAWQHEPSGTRFAALGTAMGRRPALFAAVSGLVMIALAIGAFGYKADFDLGTSSTPKDKESIVTMQTLQRYLPAGQTNPSQVWLESTDGKPLNPTAISSFADGLKAVPGVGTVQAPAQLAKLGTPVTDATGNEVAVLDQHGTVAVVGAVLKADPSSNAAVAVVRGPLRGFAHDHAPPGTRAVVGGETAVYADVNTAVNRDFSVVFPVAAVLIMLILALLLRSLVAPWYLMVSVGLGFGATLGATVLVFQNLQHQAGLTFFLPVIIYLFVVAVGTDYNILMVARLREEAKEGREPRAAAAMAVRHAGPTIAAAGIILAGTFASLMLGGNTQLSQMGFAVSFGIVVAAFVMALFFTPTVTALIGHLAWWPGHGDRPRTPSDGERSLAPSGARRE